jgi:acyl-coenzyme A synthetase/AMP-(fatty) acid ligase/ankyrin repeat protein
VNDEKRTIDSTSYETLLLLAAGVVHQIREEYFAKAQSRRTDGGGVVFAVTIPEGPLLPLSILVVHALNVFLRQHDDPNPPSYAVLVPMDLDEGKDRNAHILMDASPAFALTVPGRDSEKLEGWIEAINGNEQNDNDSTESPAPITKTIDLMSLTKVARRKLSSLSANIESGSTKPTIGSSCYSELIASASATATSLQELVSSLATHIGAISSNAIPNSDEEHRYGVLFPNIVSHIVYTSGTTGRPKGCVSSTVSLKNYITAKNQAHDISEGSIVLLASALSFDPCLSDVLATLDAGATLAVVPRQALVSGLTGFVKDLEVTHVLCTPTLWNVTLLNRSKRQCVREEFPNLRIVALGGEPIPKSLSRAWARTLDEADENADRTNSPSCRLLATYGVTEACVYQTYGEVFSNAPSEPGQCVGHALGGNGYSICDEMIQGTNLVELPERGIPGEIVLFGDQIDACSKYLNRADLDGKFVAKSVPDDIDGTKEAIRYYYRTGDRGYVRPTDGSLVVLDRIVGEEGMIKINGVRVELGEIEAALSSGEGSDDDSSIVTDCLVKCVKDSDGQNTLHAYCVFPEALWNEIGTSSDVRTTTTGGTIINGGPLWMLLRTKCSNRLRKVCIPSAFVGIRRLPLSRTGKRDRSGLPGLDSCSLLESRDEMSVPLQDYGGAGGIVFETLVQYLNLQPCQQQMVTRSVSFAVLGGDSLSAVVVCRTLYAHFHRLQNSRHLGGEYGQLPEPFDAANLLRAKNMGEYVDLLDESVATNNLRTADDDNDSAKPQVSKTIDAAEAPPADTSENALLYDALLQATTLDQTTIAAALVHLGADPNHGHNHGSRIGNTSGRIQRRAIFKTSPLHLACFRGNLLLVKLLLSCKASYKSPNTNGLFPIHLAAGGEGKEGFRLECVKALMEAGCPLLIKDANKQSVLHAAARAGHVSILEHAIGEHQSDRYTGPVPLKQFLDFQDKWFRSALHWAVLHGNVRAAALLLKEGIHPSPYKPRPNSNRQTSMLAETPLEICRRLHGGSDKGIEMEQILLAAIESFNPS